MKGRCLSNNIRLVLDLIDHADSCPDDTLIWFLDFWKRSTPLNTTLCFRHPRNVVLVSTCVQQLRPCIRKQSVDRYVSTIPFRLWDQAGLPCVTMFVLICAQLLSDFMIKGIYSRQGSDHQSAGRSHFLISERCLTNFNCCWQNFYIFHLNLNKCEIPVRESVTYLGIIINKNTRCPLTFTTIVDKTDKMSFMSLLIQSRGLIPADIHSNVSGRKETDACSHWWPSLELCVEKQNPSDQKITSDELHFLLMCLLCVVTSSPPVCTNTNACEYQ